MKKIMVIFGLLIVLFAVGCTPEPVARGPGMMGDDGEHMGEDAEEMEERMEEHMGEDVEEEMEERMEEDIGEHMQVAKADEVVKQIEAMPDAPCDDWKCRDLVDARNGETYQIKDFAGQKILLESFAVWCPTCLKQQKEMGKVSGVVHISLDTDPNEEEQLVKEHAADNGFDWIFSVSPIDVTKALIAEFGPGFVSAPRAPVVLICEDQTGRFLPGGLKDAEELEQEIAKGC